MADEMPVDPEDAKRMEAERKAIDEGYKLARGLIKVAGGREKAKGFIDTVDLVDEVTEANDEDLRNR